VSIAEISGHIRVLEDVDRQLRSLIVQEDYDEKLLAKLEDAIWAIKQL
jgi:hypothetical protein